MSTVKEQLAKTNKLKHTTQKEFIEACKDLVAVFGNYVNILTKTDNEVLYDFNCALANIEQLESVKNLILNCQIS